MSLRRIAVLAEGFDPYRAVEGLAQGRTDLGAVASFVGYCRDEGGRLAALELEHYPGMAEAELARIALEAETRWPLLGLLVLHRSGRVVPGEPIVAVAAAALHRGAALAAVDFVMDFLKTDAPFWKREHPAGGDAAGSWIEAKSSDDARRDRWGPP